MPNLSDWLLQVMEAEHSRTRSEIEHRETAAKYNAAIGHMRQMEKKLKRTINKSRSEDITEITQLTINLTQFTQNIISSITQTHLGGLHANE